MTGFGDRHSGHLDGRLAQYDQVKPVSVTVSIDSGSSKLAAVQHTAWMTCNMLSRLKGVVSAIYIDCADDAPLVPLVIPGGKPGESFLQELVAGINHFGLISASFGSNGDELLFVGPGKQLGPRAVGAGWVGGITNEGSIANDLASDLPFGPYIAACYIVAELFRKQRLLDYTPVQSAFYDCWDARPLPQFQSSGPPTINTTLEPITLAGVGAVGNAWLHTMWATSNLGLVCDLADSDPQGIDETNLNRYCLFGVSDISKEKAFAAAEILNRDRFCLHPFQLAFERLPKLNDFIVCAVDTNESRASIQNTYRPIMLMGATLDLRAEVLRCTAPGTNACLRCYNPGEKRESDEIIRRRMLALSPEQTASLYTAAGVSEAQAKNYIVHGKCGEPSERLLSAMRRSSHETQGSQFAVGFVSIAAGTILAAETLKTGLGSASPLNSDSNRVCLQFFRPSSNLPAGRVPRDLHCPACRPDVSLDIWKKRFVDKVEATKSTGAKA